MITLVVFFPPLRKDLKQIWQNVKVIAGLLVSVFFCIFYFIIQKNAFNQKALDTLSSRSSCLGVSGTAPAAPNPETAFVQVPGRARTRPLTALGRAGEAPHLGQGCPGPLRSWPLRSPGVRRREPPAASVSRRLTAGNAQDESSSVPGRRQQAPRLRAA